MRFGSLHFSSETNGRMGMTMDGASYVLNLFNYAKMRLQFAHVHAPVPAEGCETCYRIVLLLVLLA